MKGIVWMFKAIAMVVLWVWVLPVMLKPSNVPFRFLLDGLPNNMGGEIAFFVFSFLGYAIYGPLILLGFIQVTKKVIWSNTSELRKKLQN
ncbi:hypothetical protein [Bacillus mycoides]|uniref:hypothetical protein n=1 Tax=Bacillus mycoides TaxID=1405 RepID=UPI0002799A80|nr:hypothetical protein [Bacillus mycoides]EJR94337.1 hypothetical protein IKM_05567 [Bacillus mycoides]